jgi:hypothetical protein
LGKSSTKIVVSSVRFLIFLIVLLDAFKRSF